MPHGSEHLKRAHDNEILATNLSRTIPVCVDWAVTMRFYAAVHYIEAYFAQHYNEHHLTHDERIRAMRGDLRLRPVLADFLDLKDMSEEARYEIRNYDENGLRTSEHLLTKIRGHIQSLL